MVQVIPQMMGLGEQIGAAFGGGLQQGIPQGIQTLQNQLQQHRENTALKELSQKWKPETTDVEIMQDIMTAPVSKESKQLYLSGMGQLMKQKEQEKKRTFLENIISGRPQAAVTEEVTGEDTIAGREGQAPKDFSEQEIMATSLIDPNIAKVMVEQKKMQQKEAVQKRKDVAESYKETKEYRTGVNNAYKAYVEDKMMLDRMGQLNKKDLASPFQAKVGQLLGVPISILSNPESEEFDKLTAAMTRNIRQYYGARITNLEMSTFLRSIPSLLNSTEGRERVMKGLQIVNKPKQLEYEALKEIRKKSGGKSLPFDLQEQVTEKLEPKLNELADQFKNLSADTETVIVISPAGKKFKLPKQHVGSALKDGFKVSE